MLYALIGNKGWLKIQGIYLSQILYPFSCVLLNVFMLESLSYSYKFSCRDGDYYAAIRDCYSALDLDSDYLKAHFRLAQCLHKLNWAKEAYDCLQVCGIFI